jgi:hypothetical protein
MGTAKTNLLQGTLDLLKALGPGELQPQPGFTTRGTFGVWSKNGI